MKRIERNGVLQRNFLIYPENLVVLVLNDYFLTSLSVVLLLFYYGLSWVHYIHTLADRRSLVLAFVLELGRGNCSCGGYTQEIRV